MKMALRKSNTRSAVRVSRRVLGWLLVVAACACALVLGIGGDRLPSARVAAQSANLDAFERATADALQAWQFSQRSQSPLEWDRAARQWMRAVAGMQSVPPDSPKRAFAQKKVVEYLRNAAFSLSLASTAGGDRFATFNSPLLDEQLALYRSYMAAVGTPDVLVLGSSRALQGVDAQALQRALEANGRPDLQVFNFGVNGATARVVEIILRQILAEDELPRTVVWADGARAFNNGRPDRTYNAIVNSPGYRNLPGRFRGSAREGAHHLVAAKALTAGSESFLAPVDLELPAATSAYLLADARERLSEVPLLESTFIQLWVSAIDANGFLPVRDRFDPIAYYRNFSRVAGRYDGDYQNFNLGGEQGAALESVVGFLRSQGVRLIVASLPVSEDYLDATRLQYEQQFVSWLADRGAALGFSLANLSYAFRDRNDYFADPSHLNADGAEAVAQLLAQTRGLPWPRGSN